MKNPLVSIIIPTYNREYTICQTLDSIESQSYQDFECLIIDDGSDDKTEHLIAKYTQTDNRFKFYKRPDHKQKGANACRNLGVEKSKGSYIMFVDSDDICAPFCIENRMQFIAADRSIDILISNVAVFSNGKKTNEIINRYPENDDQDAYLRMFLRYEIPWQIMGALYKRDVLGKCTFDENLKRFQDVSFNIRLLSGNKGLTITRSNQIDSYYRLDETKMFSPGFIDTVLDAILVFYKSHQLLAQDSNYKKDFRIFSLKIILEYLIPNFSRHTKKSNSFLFWAVKSPMYSAKQKNAFVLLIVFLNLGLFTVKGAGMNKFRKRFKKIVSE